MTDIAVGDQNRSADAMIPHMFGDAGDFGAARGRAGTTAHLSGSHVRDLRGKQVDPGINKVSAIEQGPIENSLKVPNTATHIEVDMDLFAVSEPATIQLGGVQQIRHT